MGPVFHQLFQTQEHTPVSGLRQSGLWAKVPPPPCTHPTGCGGPGVRHSDYTKPSQRHKATWTQRPAEMQTQRTPLPLHPSSLELMSPRASNIWDSKLREAGGCPEAGVGSLLGQLGEGPAASSGETVRLPPGEETRSPKALSLPESRLWIPKGSGIGTPLRFGHASGSRAWLLLSCLCLPSWWFSRDLSV